MAGRWAARDAASAEAAAKGLMQAQTTRVIVLALLAAAVGLFALAGALRLRFGKPSRLFRRLVFGAWALIGLGLACIAYGILLEADWLEVTHTTLETSKLPKGTRLRIAQVSDLHCEGWTTTLRTLAERINAEKPDVFIFTGDTLNSLDGIPVVQEIWKSITAPGGKYAVQGNHDVWYWKGQPIFPPELITELRDAPAIQLLDGAIALCGAKDGRWDRMENCHATARDDQFLITASHKPDVIGDFVQPRRPDLLLAGHTHGGQIAMPFYGAVITMSRFDKRFERGLVRAENTDVYVSRGIGFEPNAPRIRFLSRPELTVIDVVGTR